MITSIQTRIKELIKNGNTTEEARKAYQLDKYGHESIADFDDEQLECYYRYVRSANPKFTIRVKVDPTIQNMRESALSTLLDDMESHAKANGQVFFRRKITAYSKEGMLYMLEQRHPDLFKGLSASQFDAFWKKQKLCKIISGVKPGGGKI